MGAVVYESPSSLVVWCAESTVLLLTELMLLDSFCVSLSLYVCVPTMQDREETLAKLF